MSTENKVTKLSLWQVVSLVVVGSVLVVSLLHTVSREYLESSLLARQVEDHAWLTTELLREVVAEPVAAGDADALNAMVRELRATHPAFVQIALYDAAGEALAESGRGDARPGEALIYVRTVLLKDREVGRMRLVWSLQGLHDEIARETGRIRLQALAQAVILICLILLPLSRLLVTPLRKVTVVLNALRKGDRPVPAGSLPDNPVREVHDLSQVVRLLQDSLQSRANYEEELQRTVEIRTRELSQANVELKLFEQLFQHATEAVVVTDENWIILDANPAYTRITGESRDNVVGRKLATIFGESAPGAPSRDILKDLQVRGSWSGELEGQRKNGERFYKWTGLYAVEMQDADAVRYVEIFSDITALKEKEQQLSQMAYYDPLTGLPNRVLFNDRLLREILHAYRNKTYLAILFLDLDRFKKVNDSLGHVYGDKLLSQAAQRMQDCVRKSDTVARHSGDEFTVILTDVQGAQFAAKVAASIVATLQEPFVLGEYEVLIGSSIGIALFPEHGTDHRELLKRADKAMYEAKARGRNNYQFYSPEFDDGQSDGMDLENQLRRALDRQELEVHYQQQVRAATGNIIGVEALLRWRNEELGMVPPGQFIPIAEASGLIVDISNWVLWEACAQARRWMDAGTPLRVSVNISAFQFRRKDLPEQIQAALQHAHLDPAMLVVELTESCVMDNPKMAIEQLRQIKQLGVHISVDDFGTGYSSLAYLKRFPIDELKIDREFVRDAATDATDASIIEAILALAHSLGLETVAEGVEDEEQARLLREKNCTVLQGFLFGRPVPPEELSPVLETATTA